MKMKGLAWRWQKLSTEALTSFVVGATVLAGAGMFLAANILAPTPIG